MEKESTGLPISLFWIIAVFLGGLGLLFLIAAQQSNTIVRIILGVGCLVGSSAMFYLARLRPVQHTHIHKMEVDLPGEVTMKSFECKSCGATLDSGSITAVGGAIQVNCPYCGTSYQMEEAAKW